MEAEIKQAKEAKESEKKCWTFAGNTCCYDDDMVSRPFFLASTAATISCAGQHLTNSMFVLAGVACSRSSRLASTQRHP